MPQITLRVSKEEYDEIQRKAENEKLTMKDFIMSKVFTSHLDNRLTLDDLIIKVEMLEKDTVFTLRSLYDENLWNDFTPGSRISAGRRFFSALNNNEFNLKCRVEFIGKNSENLAMYKKLTKPPRF